MVLAGSAIAGLILLSIVAALQFFVADKTPKLTAEDLQAAMERWQRAAPKGYDMDLELRGAEPGKIHVEVRDSKVTAQTRNGQTPPERTWETWSVPGMFDTLERELELAEDPEHEMDVAAGTKLQLRCAFDAKYGYPSRYHRFTTGAAPEVDWRVTRFEPK
jgi:hypothetical protein